MKKMVLFIAVILITVAMAMSVWAGEWRSDSHGWWYTEDDGSYPVNQWREINGKHYYFGADGYMLANTTTPDGYQVGADGAWIQGGSNELPSLPYAGILNAFRATYANEPSCIIKSFIDFKRNDLVDHGDFYEIKGQSIQSWFGNPDLWDHEGVLYTGSVYVYKKAKNGAGLPATFEQALYDPEIKKDSMSFSKGMYHWGVYLPDEKGYFSEFAPVQAE